MKQEFTISVYSENHVGLLNQITTVFFRRRINIESLTTSESAIKGIHKFTIVVNTTKEQVDKLIGQIEKCIDVVKAVAYLANEIIHAEVALYKVPTEAILGGNEIEKIVRQYGARILEVKPEFTVIEKTGHKSETQALLEKLQPYGLLQFVRSGRIAITSLKTELLDNYLKNIGSENQF